MSQELTLKVAQKFLQENDAVDLCEFKSIFSAAAEALGKSKGVLYLRGLTTLSDAAAKALAKLKGYLDLSGLTTLSDASAEALGKHKGALYLRGLTTLSDVAAEALARHKGNLDLDGLTTLSDAAAEALAKHEGDLISKLVAKHKEILERDGAVKAAGTRARKKPKFTLKGEAYLVRRITINGEDVSEKNPVDFKGEYWEVGSISEGNKESNGNLYVLNREGGFNELQGQLGEPALLHVSKIICRTYKDCYSSGEYDAEDSNKEATILGFPDYYEDESVLEKEVIIIPYKATVQQGFTLINNLLCKQELACEEDGFLGSRSPWFKECRDGTVCSKAAGGDLYLWLLDGRTNEGWSCFGMDQENDSDVMDSELTAGIHDGKSYLSHFGRSEFTVHSWVKGEMFGPGEHDYGKHVIF